MTAEEIGEKIFEKAEKIYNDTGKWPDQIMLGSNYQSLDGTKISLYFGDLDIIINKYIGNDTLILMKKDKIKYLDFKIEEPKILFPYIYEEPKKDEISLAKDDSITFPRFFHIN